MHHKSTPDSHIIPRGYCQCGCGQRTRLHRQNIPERGVKKGDPQDFVRYHYRAKPSGYTITGEHAEVPLMSEKYPGLVAKVDLQDADRVGAYRWNPKMKNRRCYATSFINGEKTLLHQFVLGVKGTDGEVDHINHDGLDNRRANLRVVDTQRNQANKRPVPGTTSQYKGVCLRENGMWHAQISFNKRKISIGNFREEEDAARAYDRMAKQLFGEYAYLNFPEVVDE